MTQPVPPERATTQPETQGPVCFKCSAPLGQNDKRCPFCGIEQPMARAVSPSSPGQPPPFEAATVGLNEANQARAAGPRPLLVKRQESTSAMTVFGAFVALGLLGGGSWVAYHRLFPPPPPPPPARLPPLPPVISSVSGLPVPDADRADPTAMVPMVQRAVAPNDPDVQLLGIYVTHSRKGAVDLREAESSIVYAFAQLAEKTPHKPKVPYAAKGYELKLNGGGPRVIPLKKDDAPVPEPNCVWSAAWRSAVRGGIPEDARVDGVYEKIGGEPRWRITVPNKPDLTREIDGMSCAIKQR